MYLKKNLHVHVVVDYADISNFSIEFFLPGQMGPSSNLLRKKIMVENLVTLAL